MNNHIPIELRERGLKEVHPFPRVSTSRELFWLQQRAPSSNAWLYKYIEHQPSNSFTTLTLDIDDIDKYDYALVNYNLPEPSWESYNTDTGHAHISYILKIPVHRNKQSRYAPLKYLKDMSERFTILTGADQAYHGIYTLSPYSKDITTKWSTSTIPFELSDFDIPIPKNLLSIPVETGIGRNCDMFATLVKQAHQPKWGRLITKLANPLPDEWLEHAQQINKQSFNFPLPYSEVKSIAKSAGRYSLQQFSEQTFSQIQKQRQLKRWSKYLSIPPTN